MIQRCFRFWFVGWCSSQSRLSLCERNAAFAEQEATLTLSRSTELLRKQNCVASLRSSYSCLLLLATILCFVDGQRAASAQDSVKTSKADTKPETNADATLADKKKTEITEADRAHVLKFAKENHPELAGLLEQLQKSRPNEFSKAVRELHQQVRALDRVRERSPARYEEQLASWKRDSKIRLLMARWAKKNDPALEQEIRALLKERREARLAQLRSERERLNQMQRKLDEQLLEMEQPMDQQISAEWDLLSRRNRKTDRKDE